MVHRQLPPAEIRLAEKVQILRLQIAEIGRGIELAVLIRQGAQRVGRRPRGRTRPQGGGGGGNQEYTYNIPVDVYFTVLDHEGYKVYEDENGNKEFTEYQMQIQNPETDLSLYVKTASSK